MVYKNNLNLSKSCPSGNVSHNPSAAAEQQIEVPLGGVSVVEAHTMANTKLLSVNFKYLVENCRIKERDGFYLIDDTDTLQQLLYFNLLDIPFERIDLQLSPELTNVKLFMARRDLIRALVTDLFNPEFIKQYFPLMNLNITESMLKLGVLYSEPKYDSLCSYVSTHRICKSFYNNSQLKQKKIILKSISRSLNDAYQMLRFSSHERKLMLSMRENCSQILCIITEPKYLDSFNRPLIFLDNNEFLYFKKNKVVKPFYMPRFPNIFSMLYKFDKSTASSVEDIKDRFIEFEDAIKVGKVSPSSYNEQRCHVDIVSAIDPEVLDIVDAIFQGNHFKAEGVYTMYSTLCDNFKARVSNSSEKLKNSIAVHIKDIFDRVFALYKSNMNNTIISFVDRLRCYLVDFFSKILQSFVSTIKIIKINTTKLISWIGWVTSLSLSHVLGKKFFDFVFAFSNKEGPASLNATTVFYSEGPGGVHEKLAKDLLQRFYSSFNLLPDQKTLNYFNSMVLLFRNTSSMWLFFLRILPMSVSTFFEERVGVRLNSDKVFMHWHKEATVVISASNIPSVITCVDFRLKLKDLINRSFELWSRVRGTPDDKVLMAQFQKLIIIYGMIEKSLDLDQNREEPYCFAICSDPGVGKTRMHKLLLRDCFGKHPESIYYRPTNTAHWDGYNQTFDTIVYDEFGASKEFNTTSELLTLVSSNNFIPPQASVDDPSIGIKGTKCSPKFVVTLANDPYPKSNDLVDKNALYRRRKLLIRARISKEFDSFCVYQGNRLISVDLPAIIEACSTEQLARKSYWEFTLLNPVPCNGVLEISEPMSYNALCSVLKSSYAKHISFGERFSTELNPLPKLAFDNIYEQIYKSILGVSETENDIDILGALTTFIKPDIFGFEQMSKDTPFTAESLQVFSSDDCSALKYQCVDPLTDKNNIIAECVDKYVNGDFTLKQLTDVLNAFDNVKDVGLKSGDEALYITTPESYLQYLFSFVKRTIEGFRVREVIPVIMVSILVVNLLVFLWAVIKIIICAISHLKGLFSTILMAAGVVSHIDAESDDEFKNNAKWNWYSNKRSKSKADSIPRFGRASKFYEAEGGLEYGYLQFDGCPSSRVIPLLDRKVLTYSHMFLLPNGKLRKFGTHMLFTYKGVSYDVEFEPNNLYLIKDDDVAVYDLSEKRIQQFKNIVGRFSSYNDLASLSSFRATLRKDINDPEFIRVNRRSTEYNFNNLKFKPSSALQYTYPSKPGDCGSLIFGEEGPLYGKICGMHVAGAYSPYGTKEGCAVVLHKEMLQALDFTAESEVFYDCFDNLKSITDNTVTIFVPPKSKLVKTSINEYFTSTYGECDKEPSILTSTDKRNRLHEDPLLLNLYRIGDVKKNRLEPKELLAAVGFVESLIHKEITPHIFVRRELTLDECVNGIPGKFTALKFSSSAGYPFILDSRYATCGKKALLELRSDGTRSPTSYLLNCLKEFEKQFYSHNFEDHYVAYLKDELVSQEKIENVRTRIIFSSNITSQIFFRRKLGCITSAFNNSCGSSFVTLGINPTSHDFHKLYLYLQLDSGDENYIAMDYKDFDRRTHPRIQYHAYRIFVDFIQQNVSHLEKNFFNLFYDHQTQTSILARDKKFSFVSLHSSGCYLTTIINSINNGIMLISAFLSLCPGLDPLKHIRFITHGDDVVINVDTVVKHKYNAVTISNYLKVYNQLLTSDIKGEELTSDFRKFSEITFLGCHPRYIHGYWAGALRKKSLLNMLYWRKSYKGTDEQNCRTALEMASVWDADFYNRLQGHVIEAMAQKGKFVESMPYDSRQLLQLARTTTNYSTYFIAECPSPLVQFETVSEPLVSIESSHNKLTSMQIQSNSQDFSMNSLTQRINIQWLPSHSRYDVVFQTSILAELLRLGSHHNLQNYEFSKWLYWRGDVKITIQITGQAFQQGLLALAFEPLNFQLFGNQVSKKQVTNLQHVLIDPRSTVIEMTIPFRYRSQLLNISSSDSLGLLYLMVLSPLYNGSATGTVNLSIYTSFPNSEFYVPRSTSTMKRLAIAEGAQMSYITNNNTIDINNSAIGAIPVENVSTQLPSQTIPEVSINPFDNPPLVSGSLPVHIVTSGMSKIAGIEPTVALQLHPTALTRTDKFTYGVDYDETNFEYLASKKSLHSIVTWSCTDIVGSNVFHEDLVFPMIQNKSSNDMATLQDYILDMFSFWRADILFEVKCVRSAFQTGRLKAVVSYGEFTNITYETSHNGYSGVLEFNELSSTSKILIPYNTITEFLCTYDGPRRRLKQAFSLGQFDIFVENQLIVSDSTENFVEVIIFVSLANLIVNVPRSRGFIHHLSTDISQSMKVSNKQPTQSSDFINPMKYVSGSPIILSVDIQLDYLIENILDDGYVEALRINGFIDADNNWTDQGRSLVQSSNRKYNNHPMSFIISLILDSGWSTSPLEYGKVKGYLDSRFSFVTHENLFRLDDLTVNSLLQLCTFLLLESDLVHATTLPETDVEVVQLTDMENQVLVNKASKLIIGNHFEFCPKNFYDVYKRYYSLSSLDYTYSSAYFKEQVSVTMANRNDQSIIFNIENYPKIPKAIMFAGWKGSLKYRAFFDNVANIKFITVTYSPMVTESTGAQHYPSLTSMHNCITYLRREGDPRFYVSSAVTYNAGSVAVEHVAHLMNGGYIDFQIPCETIYKFLNNNLIQSGSIDITLDLYKDEPQSIRLYQSLGDDFSFGIFRSSSFIIYDYDISSLVPGEIIPFGLGGLANESL